VSRPRWATPWTVIALWRWARRTPQPGEHGYHRGRRVVIGAFLGMITVELLVVHLILLVIFGSTWWVWLIFAVDAYTVCWVLGLYAGMAAWPHRLDQDALRLRHGYQAELVVPRAAIRGARVVRHPERKSGRLVVDGGTAVFCCGEATVRLDLDPAAALRFRGEPVPPGISTLHVTADAPAEFARAVSAAVRAPGAG
jgi:hypothetical protein